MMCGAYADTNIEIEIKFIIIHISIPQGHESNDLATRSMPLLLALESAGSFGALVHAGSFCVHTGVVFLTLSLHVLCSFLQRLGGRLEVSTQQRPNLKDTSPNTRELPERESREGTPMKFFSQF